MYKNKIAILIIVILFTSCFPLKIHMLETAGNAYGKRYYIKDINNYYDNVIGIWKWKNANNSFELTLQKFEKFSDPLSPTQYKDEIFGKYKLIADGKIIAETNKIKPFPDAVVVLNYITPTKYSIIIHDIISETHKVGEFIITSSKTATFKLKDNTENIRLIFDKNKELKEFALPMEMTLVKIN